jgi:hypothetical protein
MHAEDGKHRSDDRKQGCKSYLWYIPGKVLKSAAEISKTDIILAGQQNACAGVLGKLGLIAA